VHYSLWLAEVGCAKVASANVEMVFSGAGRISMKSHTRSSSATTPSCTRTKTTSDDWLRPKLNEEIVAAYMRLYGKESRDSDNESDGSDGTGKLEEEDGEEDREGGGEEHY
jgi:hypothetical protein